VADTPEACAATQSDLDRLEKLADRNLMNSARGKAKSCTCGGRTSGTSTQRWMESIFSEKDLELLVDTKLNTS